jgi:outer membrane protein assembly factor BamA
MTGLYKHLSLFIIICGLYSCSVTKYVPDGEYLLDRVKIESDIEGYGEMELNQYIRQHPNFRMFAISRTTFRIYNLSGRDSSKWHNRFLKKIGEEPVIFDSTLVDKSRNELTKLFINKGYVNVYVSSGIVKKNKLAEVTYTVRGNVPYRIGNYSAAGFIDSSNQQQSSVAGEQSAIRNSPIKTGMLFDRDALDAERDRITHLLRNRGYYRFNKEFISYEADSALNNNTVNLTMKIDTASKSHLPAMQGNNRQFEKYFIDRVNIYLDFDPLMINNISDYTPYDSLQANGYTVFRRLKRQSVRTGTLIENCHISPHTMYSQQNEDATYASISSLGAINNVHIHFDEFTRNDSSLLNATVLTMPARKLSFTYSVEGINTAGNLGVATDAGIINRNLFRGSETFNFKIRGAYETISNFDNPYLEFGMETSISIPKLIFPVNNSIARTMRTSTEFSLSYNSQARPEYSRTLFSGGIHYTVQGRERTAGRHRFDLLDIDYVYLPKKDSTFMSRLPSGAQYFGYTDQFIVGAGYSYTKTTLNPLKRQRNAYSLRLQFESAGNMLYGLTRAIGSRKDDGQVAYELLNTYFAQFIKGNIDYSQVHSIDSHNSIAWRAGFGAGLPYGNSRMLPFEKRYYSGGANSVRAWTVRELGPGSYSPGDSTTFFNQSGDIKLDLSIEYRTRFFWKFEAAAFIDAGNIWTVKDYPGQEGGRFNPKRFYRQIAVGHGLGLRLDMNFFLIRFDCGWKTYNPALRGREAWTVLHPNFSDNWAWHIAVGYPF